MATSAKWAAQLSGVREVSLLGSADLQYWQQRLAIEELAPLGRDGRATIMVVSAAGTFAGIRFCELSISVLVAPPETPTELPTWFLARAFNSNRFFAFCERVFFHTPYDFAQVAVHHDMPVSMSVTRHGHTEFQAAVQRGDGRTADASAQDRDEAWTARILLPHDGRPGHQRKLFFARIRGATRSWPFNHGQDVIVVQPRSDGDVLSDLAESGFRPVEWIVRANASHAKSKTYKVSDHVEMDHVAGG